MMLTIMYFLSHSLSNIPTSRTFIIKNCANTYFSWEEFYQDEPKTRVYQSKFNDYTYETYRSYYLKNLVIHDLKNNAIFLKIQNTTKFLVESCSFSDIVTNFATKLYTDNWDDTEAGAIWFGAAKSSCIINRCSANRCYNKIKPSDYYRDGGNFANFRFTENKILLTSIQSCAPDYYGVNAFRSRDTSGNYTGLNISNCKAVNTPMFTKFPGQDDSIKYSLFNGNLAKSNFGIAIVYKGNFTIDSCYFFNNSASYLIRTTHGVKLIVKNSIFTVNIYNDDEYIACAFYGRDGNVTNFSNIYIQNCYFETENPKFTRASDASISYDHVNNTSIKDEVIKEINNQFRFIPITNSQPIYQLRMRRAHVKY